MAAAAILPISLHSKALVSFEATPSRHSWRTGDSGGKEGRSDSEILLIERCLAGEQFGWEELIQTYSKRVYSICYRFTGSGGEAQDLTQEVFLRLFKSLSSYRAGEGSFTVWLTRLTRNLLVDHYRRSKKERLTDTLDERPGMPLADDKVGSAADAPLARRETAEAVQMALTKLSPELREALILRDIEEMDYREIARVLDIPEGTVKSRLNRGRAELARVLRRSGFHD